MKKYILSSTCFLVFSGAAHAAIMITSEKGAGTGTAAFDLTTNPSNLDLADSSQATFVNISDVFGNNQSIDILNDGVTGNAPNDANTYVVLDPTVATFTINFDIGTNMLGYDITGINSFAGWNTASNGRSNQGYDVTVHFVGGGSQLISSGTYTTVDAPSDPAKTWTGVYMTDDTGTIASGVQSITFDNFDAAAASGNVVYHEFDVYGTVTAVPEPSSSILLGLGAVALILRRKK